MSIAFAGATTEMGKPYRPVADSLAGPSRPCDVGSSHGQRMPPLSSLRRNARGAFGLDALGRVSAIGVLAAEGLADKEVEGLAAAGRYMGHTYLKLRLKGLWVSGTGFLADGGTYATTHLMPSVAAALDLGKVQPLFQSMMFIGGAIDFLGNYLQLKSHARALAASGQHLDDAQRLRITAFSVMHDMIVKPLLRLVHDAKPLFESAHRRLTALRMRFAGADERAELDGQERMRANEWGE